MIPEEKLYQGVYNGIASNIDPNYVNDNSVRKYGSRSSAVADEYVDLQGGKEQKFYDDEVSPKAVERANKSIHEKDAGINITKEVNEAVNEPAKAILSIHDDIRDLQRSLEKICDVMMEFVDKYNKDYNKFNGQIKELQGKQKSPTGWLGSEHEIVAPVNDNENKLLTGGLLGSLGSGSKDSNTLAGIYTKDVNFFAGLKDKVTKSDEEEKVLPDSDEDDSVMGRPFCKVVKGKPVERKDLYEGMSENIQIMLGVYDVYDIDYTHFFKNMCRLGSFSRFEVRLTGEKMPKHGETILLRLGNVYFALATVNDYWLRFTSRTSVNVEKNRLIPSFFKLGKIFGAKTYPEFMDAIEVTR